MQNLRRSVVLAIALLQLAALAARADSFLVRAVVDGDTIDVAGVGRVRLLGIDAPELGYGLDTPAPFAREARDRLATLVLHRWVRLEPDRERADAYNRQLAYVMTEDGVFVNAALVRDGLARVTARIVLVRLPELERAQDEAQQARRGMWGAVPQLPSAGYTRGSVSPKTRTPKANGRTPRSRTRHGANGGTTRARTKKKKAQ